MNFARIENLAPLDYAGTEALNTICANLSFAGRNLRKLIITSCEAGNGKSYLTMQIAQNMAQRGKKVVVVDGDLRRSVLIKKYGIATDDKWVGLAHYLADYNKIEEVVYQTDIEGLYFVPIGQHVANPIPLLNTTEFAQMLDALAGEFDMVLVDAPPVGLVVDAAEIAQLCDGCILVLEYEKTRRRFVKTAKSQIEQSGCPIIGCILNKVSFETLSSKKYYNQGYYSHYGYRYDESTRGRRKKGTSR